MGRYHAKRLLFAAVVLCLIYLHMRHSLNDDFYTKTVKALEKKEKDKLWKQENDAKVQQILQAQGQGRGQGQDQPQVATFPESTPQRSLPVPESQGSSAINLPNRLTDENQEPKYLPESSPLPPAKEPASSPASSPSPSSANSEGPSYLPRVRATLDDIINPRIIVIFSKTYCPHSRRAKTLLLQTYDIIPAPYVVELDTMTGPAESQKEQGTGRESNNDNDSNDDDDDDDDAYDTMTMTMTMGQALQELLHERTGRRTVPNIMVLGKSIGGADEVVRLHREGELTKTLKGMVGKGLERCERRKESERKNKEVQ